MHISLIPRRFSQTLGLVLVGLTAVLSLLPFVALCWYAHPSADDFITANEVRKYGHWGYIPFMYMQWTGRYASALFWGLFNPVAYGNTTEGYGLVCLSVLLMVPITWYALLRTLLADQLKNQYLWLSSGVLTALFLFQIPSPAEGLYWITSAYNYLLPACLSLVWLAVLVRHAGAHDPTQRRRWLLTAAVLAAAIIGTNETNAAPLLLGLGSFTLLRCLKRRRLDWEYIFLSAVVVVACAVASLAPGNFVRLSQSVRRFEVLECVRHAVSAAYRCLLNWTDNGVLLAITVLLAPISYRFSKLPDLPLNRLTRNPLFITALMPVSIVAVLTLGYWTTNHLMPSRSLNVLYLFFLLGWFLHAHAWARVGWRRGARAGVSLPVYAQWLLIGGVGFGFLNPNFQLFGRQRLDNKHSIAVAYQDWLGGAAARYDAQLTARYAYLRSPLSGDDAVVEPLRAPPITLLFIDVSRNTESWVNLAYADFFGKRSIRPATEQPLPQD